MRNTLRVLSIGTAIGLLATSGALGQAANYVLDNNTIQYGLNASDTTEPRDNWFANEFTAQLNANTITRVDFGIVTSTPGSQGDVVIYQVTGAGGNPALGATRLYTQAFTPLVGNNQANWFIQQVALTAPVSFTVGSEFLVAIFIPDVIANPPNDVYPFVIDNGTSSTGSYWDRANPGQFNLDNLSGAELVNQNLSDSTWNPGNGHLIIRAVGVPEPSVCALGGLAALTMAILRRRAK